MQIIQIHMPLSEIFMSKNNSITGVIYFQNNEVTFPNNKWTDLIVPILLNWSEQLISLSKNESNTEVLQFLDGPYSTRIDEVSRNQWRMTWIDYNNREAKEILKHSIIIEPKMILGDLHQRVSEIIDKFNQEGWNIKEIVELKKHLDELEVLTSDL